MKEFNRHQALADPRIYYDANIYEQEMRAMETKVWSLACLRSDVAENNCFYVAIVGNSSVVIQNFKGVLRAFDNVCAHRFARLRLSESGRGLLRCPYHSWVYGEDGVPIAIPLEQEAFGFMPEDRKCFALTSWKLEECGPFVFVTRQENRLSLSEYLGDFWDEFATFGSMLGAPVATFEFHYRANWKICVENTLDEYHATFVHPSTFQKWLNMDSSYGYYGLHSSVELYFKDEYLRSQQKVERLMGTENPRQLGYRSDVLFPNVTTTRTRESMGGFLVYVPTGPETTTIKARIFLNARTKGNLPQTVTQAHRSAAEEVARTILEEDGAMCEAVQAGLRRAPGPGVAGRFEQRILHFQRNIAEVLGSS